MRPLGLLLFLTSLCQASLAAQVISRPRVDHAALADLIVNRAWQLAKGERVVIFWDPADDRGVAAPLRSAIQKAGAEYREFYCYARPTHAYLNLSRGSTSKPRS